MQNSKNNSRPITSTQAGFYFLQQLDPQSPVLNLVRLDDVRGDVDEESLKKIIKQNIKNHEIFRTKFVSVDDEVVQVAVGPSEIQIEIGTTDLTVLPESARSSELIKKADAFGSIPFDLEKPPLFRAHLFRLGPNHLVLLRVIHHLVSDFQTNRLFLDELSDLYEGKKPSGAAPGFGEYAVWEKENITGEKIKPQLDYWKEKLAGCPELLHLPLDKPRPPVIGAHFVLESAVLPADLWEKGKTLARSLGVSIFQFNAAAFLLFLHRYSGDEDVCLGSNIDFRRARGLPNLMGPAINHFMIRSTYSPAMSFKEFSLSVAQTAREAYPNTDVSVDRLIHLVKPARNSGYAPLFQAMFDVWQKEMPNKDRRLRFSRIDYAWMHGNVDLSARVAEGEGGVTIWFRYNADLFTPATIQRMLECFKNLYGQIVLNPSEKIGGFSLLPEKEQNKYLETMCGATAVYESCRGIQEYFEKQADKTPKNLALDFESKTLTYAALDEKANQLAHFLREHSVGRNTFVGILMDRSLEMFVGILGVLKAGGAYVPLDPGYPAERLQFLFEEIEAPVILTQNQFTKILPSNTPKDQRIIFVDSDWKDEIAKYPVTRPKVINQIDDMAYMIYTSGSTGKPKGCPNTHRNVGNYLQWVKSKHPMAATDKLMFRTPYTFDVSVPEILYPLFCGAQIIICAPGKHGDTGYMVSLIQEKSITEVGFVPSTLQVFLEEEEIKKCASIKVVTAIGEALPPEVVKRFFECLPKSRLINSYGPTEAAVAVTFWDCSADDRVSVPIGYPIPNTKIYILNEMGKMAPPGVYGEIFIGGVQVAWGYWKRLELTDEKFVKDPFSKDPKARMYKTGDRGRFLGNGSLEYQGRMDFQVKVRGYRIELGEIESAMLEYAGVNQAAVVVKKLHGDQGPGSIVAYYVKKDGGDVVNSGLKDFLKSKLPEYMIPAGFVALDQLPVITSGKVNRKALMERHDDLGTPEDSGVKYAPPVNETEKILVNVWEAILQTKPIGRDSNYFSLGGDSLSLIRTLHRLREYNFGLKLEDLYAHQTVADLAAFIEKRKTQGPAHDLSLPPIKPVAKTSKDDRFPLSFQQEVLWRGIMANNFNTAITLINSLDGDLQVPLLRKCLEKIMDRHGVLKTRFLIDGEKPYQSWKAPEIEYFFEKDLRDIPDEEREETLTLEINMGAYGKFDLEKSPLIKCFLFRTADDQHFIVLTAHHLIFDGLSLDILRRELKELYSAELEKRPPALSELPLQYVDFAAWEREICNGHPAMEPRLKFWEKFIKDLPVLKIPVSSKKGKKPEESEGIVRRIIEKPLLDKLTHFSKKNNGTLYVTVLAAFSSMLQQLTGQKETVFQTVFSQRPAEIENIMGYFMTIVPLRIDHSNNPSFVELVRQVRERSFETQSNLVPGGKLWDIPLSEKDRQALGSLGVMFNYTAGVRDPLALPGIVAEHIELEGGAAKMGDLFVQFSVSKDHVNYFFSGDLEIFSDEAIGTMADKFEALLSEMASS